MAEPFADYFDLQLRLAAAMSERTATPFREAMSLYTNLGRRLGLFDKTGPDWLAYLDGLEAASDRLAWTMAVFAQQTGERVAPGQTVFGCFACEAPAEDGTLRIHFQNREFGQGPSPLSAARIEARLADLRAMFGFIQRQYPAASAVRGGSWLYNLEAYRRLFPAEYGASRQPAEEPIRLSGTSTWGQMVDHRGLVRPEARSAFLAALEGLDVERPWRAFPLRTQITSAPLAAFFGCYGL